MLEDISLTEDIDIGCGFTRHIGLISKALIVHTEHDMGERVGFVLVLAGRIRLINHQRWFGCEDTHIIDEVLKNPHACNMHWEDINAEFKKRTGIYELSVKSYE